MFDVREQTSIPDILLESADFYVGVHQTGTVRFHTPIVEFPEKERHAK